MTKTREAGVYARRLAGGATVYDAVAKVRGVQRWSRGHHSLDEAAAKRDEMRVAMRRGEIGTAPARLTLGEYIDSRWWPSLEETMTNRQSLRVYRASLKHVTRLLGDRRLAELRVQDIEDFKREMRRDGVGASMQAAAFGRLRHALKDAVRLELIWRNPCDVVHWPAKGKHTAPDLSVEDVTRLLRIADETTEYGTLFMMAVLTGLRWGELTGLTWSDVDFATGVARVRRSTTKTDAGARPMALGPLLTSRLQQHRLEEMKRFTAARQPAPQLVFTTVRGKPLRQQAFHKAVWGPLRERLGLPEMHFHDLKHVNSTLMARLGTHPSLMQRRLGHASSRLSLEVYTDLQWEDQVPLAAGLEEMLGSTPGSTRV